MAVHEMYRSNSYQSEETSRIRDVWAWNLEEELAQIQMVVQDYKYIALDTEFPGTVVKPSYPQAFKQCDYHTVKVNVDMLNVIQLGITFADEYGNLPPDVSTWQFNFQFDLTNEVYAENSIQFLKDSAGIDFEKHRSEGIPLDVFGEQIMHSGLIMNEDVKWISFHGTYDFCYLLKVLTCDKLPEGEQEFFESLHMFFPSLYDIKYLLGAANLLAILVNGQSLQKVAEHLKVDRIGQEHQAGSDSLITCRAFFRLMTTYFDNKIDDNKYSGVIYGLGAGAIAPPPNRQISPPHNNGAPRSGPLMMSSAAPPSMAACSSTVSWRGDAASLGIDVGQAASMGVGRGHMGGGSVHMGGNGQWFTPEAQIPMHHHKMDRVIHASCHSLPPSGDHSVPPDNQHHAAPPSVQEQQQQGMTYRGNSPGYSLFSQETNQAHLNQVPLNSHLNQGQQNARGPMILHLHPAGVQQRQ